MYIKRIMVLALAASAIHLAHAQTSLLPTLTGNWQFIASNNGKEVAPGVYSAGTDTINFTATASEDGTALLCHADRFYTSVTGNSYPADWHLTVEENGDDQYRLGWVLTTDQPISDKEFHESKSSYLENGFFYFGSGDDTNEHRYIYLLADNSDLSAFIGTTFWSEWCSNGTTEHVLADRENQSYKFYVLVGNALPYSSTTGYLEIWASPKLKQLTTTAIHDVSSCHQEANPYYDLWGRRLSKRPHRGVYLYNGRKLVVN